MHRYRPPAGVQNPARIVDVECLGPIAEHATGGGHSASRGDVGLSASVLLSAPMCSIVTVTTSPGSRNRPSATPVPPGVPVRMTSPASSVRNELTYASSCGTVKISSDVEESWRTTPLTLVVI